MTALDVLAENGVVERSQLPDEVAGLGRALAVGIELAALDIRLRLLSVSPEVSVLPTPLRATATDFRLAAVVWDCSLSGTGCAAAELRTPWTDVFTFAGDVVKSELWDQGEDLLTRLGNQAERFGELLSGLYPRDEDWADHYWRLQATLWACQAVGVFGSASVGADTEEDAARTVLGAYEPPRATRVGVLA
jgi:hypothetical protein